jgi:hypothetical protein
MGRARDTLPVLVPRVEAALAAAILDDPEDGG